ncbi:MAG: glutaredoxin family protein [Anaerolineae bacterium]|nr:glutaredoxin family protein [Anaerolineae bacterium]
MTYTLVMVTRTLGCPFVRVARAVLKEHGIPCREINIDCDREARAWLLETVGFLSVPTLVLAGQGSDRPVLPPAPLPAGASPRGIDRGSIITEPSSAQLTTWLAGHGFLAEKAE